MAKLVKGSKAAKDYMAKIRAKKVGATLFVEKGESPSKPKYTKVLQRNRTPIGKPKAGTFRGNTRIGFTNKISGLFDTSIISDIDQLKKEYFKLAKIYHPDKGGSTAQFQQLQNEYEKHFKALLKGSNLSQEQQANEIQLDANLQQAVNAIINLPMINIELMGKWIWVSGSGTYAVRNELKQAGFMFAGKKKMWYYKGAESGGRGNMDINEIRVKYDAKKIQPKPNNYLSGINIPASKKNSFLAALKKLTKNINKRPI